MHHVEVEIGPSWGRCCSAKFENCNGAAATRPSAPDSVRCNFVSSFSQQIACEMSLLAYARSVSLSSGEFVLYIWRF